MSTEPSPPPAEPEGALPPRTTPTWEMELLLSGATVVALLQAYAALAPRAPELAVVAGQEAMPLLLPLLLYLQAAMLGLAGGLLIHLLLRAYWIALVGLHSVDPAGSVRRSRALGPWQRARIGEAWDALPARIAALDDRATVVFAVALGIARLMAQLFVYASILVLLGLGLDFASGGRAPAGVMFPVLVAVLLGPMVTAVAVDNRAGRRGVPTPAWAQRVLGFYDRLGMTAQHSLSLQVMVHRLGGGRGLRGRLGVVVLMLVLMLATTLLPLALRGELTAQFRAGFPRLSIGAAEAVRFNHYDVLVPDGAIRRTPSIPSPEVDGPWLSLFVPWVDEWHADLLAGCSAGHAADWVEGPAAAAVLACVAEAHPITVDGQPRTIPWLLADDGGLGRRGFVVMIDVRSLPPGRHLLTIQPPPKGRDADAPDRVWRIPFWT
jgi:hypothetical protein